MKLRTFFVISTSLLLSCAAPQDMEEVDDKDELSDEQPKEDLVKPESDDGADGSWEAEDLPEEETGAIRVVVEPPKKKRRKKKKEPSKPSSKRSKKEILIEEIEGMERDIQKIDEQVEKIY